MPRGNKNISSNVRPEIERVKGYIRSSTRPFDGDGYIFQTAVKELRKEGYTIKRNRDKCNYQVIKKNNNMAKKNTPRKRTKTLMGFTYQKTHRLKKAADEHARKLKARGATVKRYKVKGGYKITYTF